MGCPSTNPSGTGGGGNGGSGGGAPCVPAPSPGDPKGHADPTGAKAAGQARAGRIDDLSIVAQPAHGRQRIAKGDYLLINDKIAVTIEDKGISDGYARFGGEILAVDRVGDDGKPMGLSLYNETLAGVTLQMIEPTSVGVLKDGSDGGEAVVRVVGPLKVVPFLDGPIKSLFPKSYDIVMAYDYALRPGDEKVTVRAVVANTSPEALNFGVDRLDKDEYYGFFHYSRTQMVTAEKGFGDASGATTWVGFDGGPLGFAFVPTSKKLQYGFEQSGFVLYWDDGFMAPSCETTVADRMDIVAGGPEYDGLGEAIRRAKGEPAWRAVTGTLKDGAGAPVAGAWIHGVGAAGEYLTRTRTAADGTFTVHAPPSAAMTIVPQKIGYPPHQGISVGAAENTAMVSFAPHGVIHVTANEQGTNVPVPVRVQVIPQAALPPTPAAFGVLDEVNGRLHQEFAVTGDATLIVPPGDHRVIVSRGYEWEMLDTTVTVAAGETKDVTASLVHSVDTAGVMCADFHIHSMFSADSSDSVVHKVKGAIADGLDIPISSEHEWVVDFQPIIQDLGLTQWAFGMPSSELTTFTWGHFGVVPLTPNDGALNRGAVDWVGKKPVDVFALVDSLPDKPALVVNHPRSANIGGYFTASSYKRDTGLGDPELFSDNFDAIEVFNSSDFEKNRATVVADWFSFLSFGKKVWAVGSSDSHHLRTSPVGYPRTCLYFGHDNPAQLTPSGVRDVVLAGTSTISGGLYMTVTGPSGERPGATVTAAAGTATFLVTVEMPSWISADTLETIVDGATVSVEPLLPMGAGPSKKFVNQVTVTFNASSSAPHWVVFHAKGETDLAPLHPGKKPFAVSNPVFLKGS